MLVAVCSAIPRKFKANRGDLNQGNEDFLSQCQREMFSF